MTRKQKGMAAGAALALLVLLALVRSLGLRSSTSLERIPKPPELAPLNSAVLVAAPVAKAPALSGFEAAVASPLPKPLPAPPSVMPPCPETAPADGSPCAVPADGAKRCGYGDPETVVCDCDGTAAPPATWRCGSAQRLAGGVCPAERPAPGEACALRNLVCHFGDAPDAVACTCGDQNQPAWSCKRYIEWLGAR